MLKTTTYLKMACPFSAENTPVSHWAEDWVIDLEYNTKTAF